MRVRDEDRQAILAQHAHDPGDHAPVERADDLGMAGGRFAERAMAGEQARCSRVDADLEADTAHHLGQGLPRLVVARVGRSAERLGQFLAVFATDLLGHLARCPRA